MTQTPHTYDPELRDVELAQHLGKAHGYHSSNDLEDFAVTHRTLHGAESPEATRIREIRNEAWQKGYDACRRGEQRHSPYRAPRPAVAP